MKAPNVIAAALVCAVIVALFSDHRLAAVVIALVLALWVLLVAAPAAARRP